MPTGGGKSLVYQIPALVRPGTGLVVSPLIALMHDQVDALVANGVRAAYLNSTQAPGERAAVERAYLAGELDLIYVAPERLSSAATRVAAAARHAQRHRDRRSPLRVAVGSRLPPRLPDARRARRRSSPAFRASRSRRRRRMPPIARSPSGCGCPTREHFVASFDRPNIQYRIEPKVDPRRQLLAFIRSQPAGSAGIVYALSRKSVEQTAEFLRTQGIDALPYHAGLDAAIRAANQSRFLRDDGVVMVATIAFGMGIDKPDVRFVAHIDLPKSVEGYYQETGRAGRDGDPAVALDGVRPRRRRAAAPAHRPEPRRSRLQAAARPAPRRDARAVRDGRMPPPEPARLLRRGIRRRAATATRASRRPTPGTGSSPRRSCCRRSSACSASAARRSARATSSTSSAAARPSASASRATTRSRRTASAPTSRSRTGAASSASCWREASSSPQGEYGTLALGEPAAAVLRGETPVPLRRDVLGRAAAARHACARPRHPTRWMPRDRPLFEALREWRAGVAKELGVPAYIVFGDATLRPSPSIGRPLARRPRRRHAASAPRSARPTARPCSRSSPRRPPAESGVVDPDCAHRKPSTLLDPCVLPSPKD